MDLSWRVMPRKFWSLSKIQQYPQTGPSLPRLQIIDRPSFLLIFVAFLMSSGQRIKLPKIRHIGPPVIEWGPSHLWPPSLCPEGWGGRQGCPLYFVDSIKINCSAKKGEQPKPLIFGRSNRERNLFSPGLNHINNLTKLELSFHI